MKLLLEAWHPDINQVPITNIVIARYMVVVQITQFDFNNNFIVAITQIFKAAGYCVVTFYTIAVVNRFTTTVTDFVHWYNETIFLIFDKLFFYCWDLRKYRACEKNSSWKFLCTVYYLYSIIIRRPRTIRATEKSRISFFRTEVFSTSSTFIYTSWKQELIWKDSFCVRNTSNFT